MSFNYNKYQEIRKFIKNSGQNTKIISISKFQSVNSVKQALESGIRLFGENKVQEALKKYSSLREKYQNIELHLTGPLQTNKVNQAADFFDVFHTLDREKLAKEFFKNFSKVENKKFFIQVNTGKEKTKSGIYPEEAEEFIFFCKKDLKLNIVGLMCIPPIDENPDEHFLLLKKIAIKNKLKDLSMGMSNDYKKAILNDATYIRIGTLLFGDR